jgi:predicted RNase H-like nuclease (RuvC/YqgF family)
MGRKVSELKASNAEKDKHIVTLEAKLKRAKEENEAEINKIRQASAEADVTLALLK